MFCAEEMSELDDASNDFQSIFFFPFPSALCVDGVHRWKISADDLVWNLYQSLESRPPCLCGVTIPGSDASGEDALCEPSVGLCEGLEAHSSFPEQAD